MPCFHKFRAFIILCGLQFLWSAQSVLAFPTFSHSCQRNPWNITLNYDDDGGSQIVELSIVTRINGFTVYSNGFFQNAIGGSIFPFNLGYVIEITTPGPLSTGDVYYISTSFNNTASEVFSGNVTNDCATSTRSGDARSFDDLLSQGYAVPYNTIVSPRWPAPFNRAEIHWSPSIFGEFGEFGGGFGDFRLSIMDQLGFQVFDSSFFVSSQAVQIITWDLRYKDGRQVPSGTYFIVVKFHNPFIGEDEYRVSKLHIVR